MQNRGFAPKYLVTVKPVLSGHSQRIQKLGFEDRLLLNACQKYCRMLQKSILKYFRPSLSYHLSSRHSFGLFLSGRLIQVKKCLYVSIYYKKARCKRLVSLAKRHARRMLGR